MEELSDTNLDRQLHTISPEQCLIRQLINPIRFSRTLIQLGYEPLPPYRSLHPLALFGWSKPLFFYPNMFAYARYLFHKRGFWYVMTTGFQARFFCDLLTDACQFMNRRFMLENSSYSLPPPSNVDSFVFADPNPTTDENLHAKRWNGLVENIMEETTLWKFGVHLSGLLAMKAYEIILTQPFYGPYVHFIFPSKSPSTF
uniref:Mitochondrial carrier homolog 2 n=1 Tax=Schistocephalus solidus TaxID=70667 RepID=A0A0X3NKB9_SCHSO